ncbi:ROK family protein [Asticcacaulis sp. BYS171W]|uniref:ROK family protein n=1 Tax=Asticcacaulis aquaticus TaxID=2984212 RepID=A0ABT5HYB0_9CAUL|nr:ROK family protein [Asticcacaulis aquaticus]MDC7685062.1 ROK family protein [Asticcacaulis aquaticus]
MLRIGVDFGGTKIEAAALLPDGTFLSRHRAPNPGDYVAALTLVRDLIARVEAEARADGSIAEPPPTIGIGSPGSTSPRTGLMRNSNSLYLNGRTFREDLQTVLERPVRLANDANCLALSEAVDGAAEGASSVFGVIIGTGCGGGVVVGQRLLDGANGIAGEWGHMPLPWPGPDEHPGPPCWCGLHGCLETWVSGSGFARDFCATTGRDLKGEAIIDTMRAGDPEAIAAFDRFLSRLGRSLAVVANLFDPDVIVFGGGLSNVGEIYERLPGLIAPYVFSDVWEARLVPARWGDSSGVRGAAYLWG